MMQVNLKETPYVPLNPQLAHELRSELQDRNREAREDNGQGAIVVEGRVTKIARPRKSISVRRSGVVKGIREGQDRQALLA